MAKLDGFGLIPEFAARLSEVLDACRANGYDFRVRQGLRTPHKQAEYYCKWARRKPSDIDKLARKLKKGGAPWLASVLLTYRDIPRQKDWLTSALPGAGWHQWGEAADCYCYRNGNMVSDGSDPCYRFYADTAKSMGLTVGYYFTEQDSGHLQLGAKSTASDVYTWGYIDEVMQERFGDKALVALSDGVSQTTLPRGPTTSFGPTLSARAAASTFYKDDPALTGAGLKPASALVTTGTSGVLRALAGIYNRVGGLLETFGALADLDPVAALAVWYVESGGRDFTPGLPVLRLENHVLFDQWGKDHAALFDQHYRFGGRKGVSGKRWQNHQYRVGTKGAFGKSHVDQQAVEYEAFRLAESLADRDAACRASSWGGTQIMGFNSASCGYGSAAEMVDAFASDERWQVLGFADFCRTRKLIDAIQHQDWTGFGKLYNGDGAVYGPKIKAAYDLKEKLLKLPRVPGDGVAPGLASSGLPSPNVVQLETALEAIA